jgi:hypothetical protein
MRNGKCQVKQALCIRTAKEFHHWLSDNGFEIVKAGREGGLMYIEKGDMKADEYIEKTREYLDYLEEHIDNVRKAFCELSEKCKDMVWILDDDQWHTLREEVLHHDISKFSQHEFIQYREAFFPINASEKINSRMEDAWEHHKRKNTHHHETAKTFTDIFHMVIDWTAMGYKFGDTAQQYYEANKDKILLSKAHKDFMYEIFDRQAV